MARLRRVKAAVTLGPLRPDDAAALLDHAVEHADPAAVREAIDREAPHRPTGGRVRVFGVHRPGRRLLSIALDDDE